MAPSQDRLGEIVAGHRLDRDTLVLLGWSGEDIPAHGVAILKKRQQGKGRFGAATWLAADQRRWFLMVIHAPEAGLSQSGDGFQLHGAGSHASTIAYAPTAMPDADGFAGELLVHLGPRMSEASRFLAEVLPALGGAPESAQTLVAACRPRYGGQDTVSSLPMPVRLAVDVAEHVPGVGWYVTGWLLDPANLVSAVMLRAAGGLNERLDATWTRLDRPDVTAGYIGDPLFSGSIRHDLHGFTVFLPQRDEAGSAAESGAWIELDLGGGRTSAFMPVAVTRGADRQRLLASVDLHKSAATEIIERHLAPLFHARGATAKARRTYRAVRAAGHPARAAVIVPIVDAATKTNVVVAHLARSLLPADAKTVFVCSPAAPDAARRLSRDLDFYGLAADVLVAPEPVDHCEALEIGVEATDCPVLVFLSPRVHSLTSIWLVDLLAALGDGGAPLAVSPTLLYEDGSVRYAGIDAVQFSLSAPYGAAVCSRAGYPRGALPRSDGRTLACAVECCAMTRAAFDSVGGFSQGYASDGFKGIDLFLRMGDAGVRLSWTAAAELYALDDLPVASDATQVARLVDGWCFRAAWQDRPSARSAEAANDASRAPVVALADLPRARVRAAG